MPSLFVANIQILPPVNIKSTLNHYQQLQNNVLIHQTYLTQIIGINSVKTLNIIISCFLQCTLKYADNNKHQSMYETQLGYHKYNKQCVIICNKY